MTVTSTFAPQQSDSASADSRRQEPSMEDILASIRRIIADDQTEGLRSTYDEPGLGSPSQADAKDDKDDPVAPAAEKPEEEDRPRPRLRASYEDVLDLASLPGAGFTETMAPAHEQPQAAPSLPEPEPAPESQGNPNVRHASIQPSSLAAPEPTIERRGPFASSAFRPLRSESDMPQAASPPPQASMVQTTDQVAASLYAEEPDSADGGLMSPVLGATVMSAFETLAATVMLQNTEMLERIMRELLRPMVKGWLDENLPTLVERLVRNEIERVARGGRG